MWIYYSCWLGTTLSGARTHKFQINWHNYIFTSVILHRLCRKRKVGLVVRWSPEGPLVSWALWSFRRASAALFRGSCVVSTECKHPTLTRSSDQQDDHGPMVFDRLLFFNMFKNSSRSFFRGDSGPDLTDWKKTILGEMPT